MERICSSEQLRLVLMSGHGRGRRERLFVCSSLLLECRKQSPHPVHYGRPYRVLHGAARFVARFQPSLLYMNWAKLGVVWLSASQRENLGNWDSLTPTHISGAALQLLRSSKWEERLTEPLRCPPRVPAMSLRTRGVLVIAGLGRCLLITAGVRRFSTCRFRCVSVAHKPSLPSPVCLLERRS